MINNIIFVFILFVSYVYLQTELKRDIYYPIKLNVTATFIYKTSTYYENNVHIFNFMSSSTSSTLIFFEITSKSLGETRRSTFTGIQTINIRNYDKEFSNSSEYNLTLYVKDITFVPDIVIQITEEFPWNFNVMSDSEPYTISPQSYDNLYFTYHTPAKAINNVKKVRFTIYDEFSSGFNSAYFSTKQFPDPTDHNTYFKVIVDNSTTKTYIYDLEPTDPNFCGDQCTYFITVQPGNSGTFSILPTITFDYIEIITTTSIIEIADISPMASAYAKFHLPATSQPNYNLEITFYYENLPQFAQTKTNIGLFVALNPEIRPSTTIWYSHTLYDTANGYLTISNNDPYFCQDCTYYFRLDGIPDQYFTIDTKIKVTISYYFRPFLILPDTYYRGFLRGLSSSEEINYQFLVPFDTTDNQADSIFLVFQQDRFVDENVSIVITNENPSYPGQCSVTTKWFPEFDKDGMAKFYISRDHPAFCVGAYYILKYTLVNYEKRQQNWNMKFDLNFGLSALALNTRKEGVIMKHTSGVYYYFNATSVDYDVYYQITFGTNCTSNVSLHVSKTSFNDGDASYEWSGQTNKTLPSSVRIEIADKNYVLTGYYFFNIDHVESWYEEDCSFWINMIRGSPIVIDLNPAYEPQTYSWNNDRAGYMYFGIGTHYIKNLTEVSFVIRSLGSSMLHAVYLKTKEYPQPKLKNYDYEIILTSFNNSYTMKKGDIGFCEGCQFFFAVSIPYYFKGQYFTMYANIKSDPFELSFGVPHSDNIEPQSVYDLYTVNIVENKNKPKLIIKLSTGGRGGDELYMAITTNLNIIPDKSHNDWYITVPVTESVSIEINSLHAKYCTGCKYLIALGPLKISGEDNQYSIEAQCPDGGCKSCSGNFSPESDCTECSSGFYGPYCLRCYCNHGKCNEGTKGDGKCVCDPGWSGSSCNDCKPQHFGLNCDPCVVDCNNKGKCSDTQKGNGQCVCDYSYLSSYSNCSDCIYGLYDHDCSDICPGGVANVCSGHGRCNSGMKGNGRCNCTEEYTGHDCATPISRTSCKPACDKNHGACDEAVGKCICYDGYTGELCQNAPEPTTPSPKPSKQLNGGVIAIIVIASILAVAFAIGVYLIKKKTLFTMFNSKPKFETPQAKYQVVS